jgi:hypothetical protein
LSSGKRCCGGSHLRPPMVSLTLHKKYASIERLFDMTAEERCTRRGNLSSHRTVVDRLCRKMPFSLADFAKRTFGLPCDVQSQISFPTTVPLPL